MNSNINNLGTVEENCNNGDAGVQSRNDTQSFAIQTTNAATITTNADNSNGNAGSTIINIETTTIPPNMQTSIGINNNDPQRTTMQHNFLPFLNEARARLGRQTSYPGSILQQTWHGNRYNTDLHRTRTTMQIPENMPTSEGPTSPPSGQLRQLRSWRLNLNNVLSFSTSPSTETLRSLINNTGNFRYTAAAPRERPTNAEDHIHILLQGQQQGEHNNSDSLAGSVNGGRSNGRTLRSFSDLGGISTSRPINNTSTANISSPELTRNDSNMIEGSSGNQPSSSSTAPNTIQGSENSPPNDEIPFDEDIISNTVITILSHVFRYLPFICILSLKFLFDHLEGILELIFLHIVMHNMNKSLRKQVAKLSQKSYAILIRDIALITLVVIYRLLVTSTPPDPFGLLISPPHVTISIDIKDMHPGVVPSQVPIHDANITKSSINFIGGLPFGLILYYVAINDLILKLLTILAKNVVTLMPTKVMRHKQRARLFVIMEYSSQLYRAVVPMHEWLIYLYEFYNGIEVIIGISFATLYMCSKIFEVVHRGQSLKKAFLIFMRNLDSQRRPTESELNAAGSVCPICHDNFVTPVVLECNHIFCDACVNTWFKREQTCPMCRAKISIDPNWEDGATTYFYQLC